MFPAKLQDTRQTTSGNLLLDAPGVDDGSKSVLTQGEVGISLVQIITVLSFGDVDRATFRSLYKQKLTWEAVAMYERGIPMFGAQATSRTQSECPSKVSSSNHAC